MRLFSVLLFFICLNLAGYAINFLVDEQVLYANKETMPYAGTDVLTQFTLTTFAIAAIGSGIAGLFGLITKQYVFASGAALIWIIGIIVNVVTWFTSGLPQLLYMLLAGTGLEVFVSAILMPIVTFYLFFFLAETLSQKPMVS